MLTALNRYNQLVIGIDTMPTEGPFYCPECGDQVIFRAGGKRTWHFAHKGEKSCGYMCDETEVHYDCKINLFRSLRNNPQVTFCMVEYKIATRRADIYAVINGYPIAIEIQNSEIRRQEIQAKLENYSAVGVHCLYILPHNIPSGSFQATEWKRYLHAMYLQNLYYWSPGMVLRNGERVIDNARVRLIHLGMYRDYPLPGCWAERHWIQPRPVFSHPQSISICDFAPLMRYQSELRSRYLGITDAMLWHHQLSDWWQENSPLQLRQDRRMLA